MVNFHITAVFETRGASQVEAERVAAAALPLLRHPRMHYYEHDTSGGLGPYPPGKSLYFTTIAEFDVEAYTEEKAVELAEDILDRFSTDTIQYFGHGIISGNQRVQPEDRRDTHEEEQRATAEPDEGQGDREERGGKGRRPQRGRGRGRKPGRRENESEIRADERTSETVRETANVAAGSITNEMPATEVHSSEEESAAVPSPPVRVMREAPISPVSLIVVEEPEPPQPPPPRSSTEMRVTLTVSLRASEVTRSDDHTTPMDEELIALAVTEARRRHPELPVAATPESVLSLLPAGDRLIALTWHYQSPVPSAAEVE